MEEKIRVLVVDDASVMRRAVVNILSSDPIIEVVDTERAAVEGVSYIDG